jgi:UDP-2,3-diacylglucosamine pyrophosphatase LpxH
MKKEKNQIVGAVGEKYRDVINVKEENHRIIVVSDLHLSGGQYFENGKYRATENFFYDEEFASFLKYLEKNQSEKPWKLIINGDFIDFLRLTECPTPKEYDYWQDILKDVGINMEIGDFDVSGRERDLGLKTHEYKSVWKMDFIGNAHPRVFKALAQFVDKGNKLVIIKGNHDAEFYWDKVRLKLKHLILNQLNLNPSDPKVQKLSEHIEICDKAYILENKIYIEHGHQYEKITSIDKPTLGQGKNDELTLPYGSFINRYLINKVELIAPFVDNIKPPTAYIDAIFKNYPIRSIKILLKYVPLAWEILKKHYWLETMKLLLKIVKYSLIPLAIIFLVLLPSLYSPFKIWLSSIPLIGRFLADVKIGGVISLIFFVMPFILPTIMRKDLVGPAIRKITSQYPGLTHVILGHFHSPDQRKYGSCSYYNSGCWTPVIDLEEKLRDSVNFCLILIDKKEDGGFQEPLLRQWNNCSGRLEKIVLIETAPPKAHEKIVTKYEKI